VILTLTICGFVGHDLNFGSITKQADGPALTFFGDCRGTGRALGSWSALGNTPDQRGDVQILP
jgi:hypothetical protein